MDYKSTLNLPQTEFPMKAELPKREPVFLKKWQEMDINRLICEKSKGRPKYILHDGPPYANGDIHIGHALNKTLKDIVIKYKTLQGCDSAFVPGWDCHGLPVEHQLFKELGINKYQIAQIDFRKKAHQYALKYVSIQREQFIRLGIFGQWQDPYLTLSSDYEESIVNTFGDLVKKGYIYRGLKPVNWCFKCETALAEAEVEYEDHTSPSIYVKFPLDTLCSEHPASSIQHPAYLIIWTTTPWTLIANVAVAVHPDFFYSHIRTERGDLIIAECREQELSFMGIKNFKKIGTFKGRDLEGMFYEHPFGLRKGKVVLADYVSKEEGTGMVHTAPGHGNEDYLTGIKYKLDIVMPVDAKGNFDSTAGEFKGMNVLDANKVIIGKLAKSGLLLFDTNIQHSYPHCWRCKGPIIFRATKQWFMNIDHRDLRKRVLGAIEKDIKWIPASGKERISSMVELRPDWCLSRQRYWGVPIPALVCQDCKEEFLDARVIENFAKFVSQEGSDAWFKLDIKDLLPAELKCPHCGQNNFSKGADILDVWFDSGVSHQAVLKKRKTLEFPCELYLEGSDQHRGWFQSSLIPSMCIDGIPPFRGVLTHGFVVDGEGRKMSKSLGNVISPQDIIKDYGADILRMWVASSDYNEDIRISKEILTRLSEAYRKIRNTTRFMLSNLYDFDPDKEIPYSELKLNDRRIIQLAAVLIKSAKESYDNFEFYKAYKNIYDFCNEDLSMDYLDTIKGRLYTYAVNSIDRRAAQQTIYKLLDILVRIMAPILVFTAEEIWQHMPKKKESASVASVHLLDWPCAVDYDREAYGLHEIKTALAADINKALEEMRNQGKIGSSFDAKINLLTNSEIRYKYLESLRDDLTEIFKVSQAQVERKDNLDHLAKSRNYPDIAIGVLKAEGTKCVRCWNYSLSVGEDATHSLICERCLKAIGEVKNSVPKNQD